MNGGASSVEGAEKPANKSVLFLRESVLLLAIQVVTVAYVAGLNPPGGVWQETKDGHLTGNPILDLTYHMRYNAFSGSNTTALMASAAVVILLLFVRGKSSERPWFNTVLRIVVSLGTLALAVAYTAGASRHKFTTSFSSVLVGILFFYVLVFIAIWKKKGSSAGPAADSSHSNSKNKGIELSRSMFTAIFVASMTYTAGLSPPGAFWLDNQEGHRAGDPALLVHYRRRFTAFFVGNTLAFMASLFIIPLVLTYDIEHEIEDEDDADANYAMNCCLIVFNNIAQYGLVIAYAAGSSMDKPYIAYVLLCGSAIFPVMVFMIVIQLLLWPRIKEQVKEWYRKIFHRKTDSTKASKDGMDPFFILLFTTLSAAVTYQAGLYPPGGLWLDDLDGHKAGDPVMLAKQPGRYRVFIYCNTMALVASLVAIVMTLSQRCQTQRSRALDGLMLLDLIGLIGAYAAGCCRDVKTSINVISLGGAVVVYVVFHMAFLMSRTKLNLKIKDDDGKVEADRDLMLGILGATLTYQTGLTPPGGFWGTDDEFGHQAGEPVLLSTYPNRYMVFFYLNALCFMASIFLTVLFVNPLLYRAGIRCRALFVCVLAVLFGLIGAYAAGSYRSLGPSICIITLGAAVFIFVTLILYLIYRFERPNNNTQTASPTGSEHSNISNTSSGDQGEQQGQSVVQEPAEQNQQGKHDVLEYLVIIGSVGATVTYQAGFAPPRSFWPDNSNGHAVGNPVLRDMDAYLYRVFFFCNTTSFAASSLIMGSGLIMWVLSKILEEESQEEKVYTILQAPTVVFATGILGAYAAGSSSGWNNNSTYALALVAPVLFCIFLIDPMVTLVRKIAECTKVFG